MYTDKIGSFVQFGTFPPSGGTSVAATGVLAARQIASRQMVIKRIALGVLTVMNSTGAIVVDCRIRPTPGSATGELVVGTISIPTTGAVGQTFYKDVAGVVCQPGWEVNFNVTTAATTSGAVIQIIEGEYDPEAPLNQTNFIASA